MMDHDGSWWIMMDHDGYMDLGSRKLGSNRCGTFSMNSCNYSVDCNVRHGVKLCLMTFKFDTFGLWRWILQLPTCGELGTKVWKFYEKTHYTFCSWHIFHWSNHLIGWPQCSCPPNLKGLATAKHGHVASGITWKLQNMEIPWGANFPAV